MGSEGSDDGAGIETVAEQQRPRPLSRQNSLYSLTLDEVQNQLGGLGKPLGSMNLDELLRNVWSADAKNIVPPPGFDSHPSGSLQAGSIQSQGSFMLSRDLSKKTVEEVWKSIQEGNEKRKDKDCSSGGDEVECDNDPHHHHQDGQPALGEMTLEDFLVKAGVVAEFTNLSNAGDPVTVNESISAPPHGQHWMQYQMTSAQTQQPHQNPRKVTSVFGPGHPVIHQAVPLGGTSILEMAYPEAHMTMSPSSLMGALSDTQMPGRKRVVSGDVVEKTVERRQKRMIKNRESAARSRARKQAYTHELEIKVSRLEEENERLRRQSQMEAEKAAAFAPPPEPKKQLRRTSSAPH